MMKYVIGFVFSEDLKKVLLIRNSRPAWQAGKLNGIGGKIEETDVTPIAAMEREFKEETGETAPWWLYTGIVHYPDVELYVYTACSDKVIYGVKSITDEQLVVADTCNISDVLANTRWMIYFAVDSLTENCVFEVSYL